MSSFLWPTRRTRRAGCLVFFDPNFRSVYRGSQQRRRARDPGAHPFAHIAPDPFGDALGAAIGLEADEVDPEPLAAFPQVGVVDATLVREQGVVERPEGVLERGGLGGERQRDRAR